MGIWVADDEPNERYPLYTRGNAGEVFPRVISALTGTLIGSQVRRGQLEFFMEMGFLTKDETEGPGVGTGVFAGYLYASASLFRLAGVRTPGMSPADADQQVAGNVEGMPPYRRSPGDRNLRSSIKVARYLLRILRRPDPSALDAARTSARAWLASMPSLDRATDAELLAFVNTYPPRLGDSMRRLLDASMVAAGPRGLVDRALTGARYPAGLANRLVSGVDDVDSAQLAVGLWDLGRTVAADPALSREFDAGLDGLEDRLGAGALEAPLREFLQRFGHRGSDEYELATPAWVMDPRPVLAAIDRLRHVGAERDPAIVMARLQADREVAIGEVRRLARGPRRRLVLRFAEVSRLGSVARERAKDILVLENLGARLVLWELARRAAARGGPTDPRLAFCVTASEWPAFLADPSSFAEVIDERAQLERYLNEREPPAWFDGTIPDPSTWPRRGDHRTAVFAGQELAGIAVSGGVASGRARVIADPGDPRGLEPGEILVCAITDPAWTPLFLVAAAVVCDTGAIQSHAAIVARELGIPAVMSVPGITAISDGTYIEVDGDRGIVRIG